jgi:hypothetical protein
MTGMQVTSDRLPDARRADRSRQRLRVAVTPVRAIKAPAPQRASPKLREATTPPSERPRAFTPTDASRNASLGANPVADRLVLGTEISDS